MGRILPLYSALEKPFCIKGLFDPKKTGFACGAFAVRFWTCVALGRPIMLIVSQRYSCYKPFIDSTGLVRFSPPLISAGSITFAFSGVESVQFNDKTFFIENSDNSN